MNIQLTNTENDPLTLTQSLHLLAHQSTLTSPPNNPHLLCLPYDLPTYNGRQQLHHLPTYSTYHVPWSSQQIANWRSKRQSWQLRVEELLWNRTMSYQTEFDVNTIWRSVSSHFTIMKIGKYIKCAVVWLERSYKVWQITPKSKTHFPWVICWLIFEYK